MVAARSKTPGLSTARLDLQPLENTAEVRLEMADVLSGLTLYLHTGGEPPDTAALRARYERQTKGASPDGSELWFNWIVRERTSGSATGYVQVTLDRETRTADLAWVTGVQFQRRGFATEAVQRVRAWVGARPDVVRVTAHIAADNVASERVAKRLGLSPTAEIDDDEVIWSSETNS